MANNIEWAHVNTSTHVTDQPGEFVDGFGSANSGPALALGNVVVEADNLWDLLQWLTKLRDEVADLYEQRRSEVPTTPTDTQEA